MPPCFPSSFPRGNYHMEDSSNCRATWLRPTPFSGASPENPLLTGALRATRFGEASSLGLLFASFPLGNSGHVRGSSSTYTGPHLWS